MSDFAEGGGAPTHRKWRDPSSSPPPRLLAHALLGAYVGCKTDARALGALWPELVVYTALLAPSLTGIVRGGRWSRLGGLGITIALVAALRYERAFLAVTLVATAVTLGATFALRRNPNLPILRRVLWALGHAVLPFMAGWTAAGASLGGSAWLLVLGLLGVHAGTQPLLGWKQTRDPAEADRAPPPGSREWTESAVLAAGAATLVMIGLSFLSVWLWTYGAGVSGLVLAAPGALGLLWLVTGWALASDDDRELEKARPQAVLAWTLVLVAIAISAYL